MDASHRAPPLGVDSGHSSGSRTLVGMDDCRNASIPIGVPPIKGVMGVAGSGGLAAMVVRALLARRRQPMEVEGLDYLLVVWLLPSLFERGFLENRAFRYAYMRRTWGGISTAAARSKSRCTCGG